MERKLKVKFPVALGIRLDAATRDALVEEARMRRMRPTELARFLIAQGLDTIGENLPVRRRVSPLRDEAAVRTALIELGRIRGDAQRIYAALSARGHNDYEIVELKNDLRLIADHLRAALWKGRAA
jgi:hypothetical protein